jgi:hypothetical protein
MAVATVRAECERQPPVERDDWRDCHGRVRNEAFPDRGGGISRLVARSDEQRESGGLRKLHASFRLRPIVKRRRLAAGCKFEGFQRFRAVARSRESRCEMPTVYADWTSRTVAWRSEGGELEAAIEDGPEGEGISARGLEILRVLNDVFNTLPREASTRAKRSHQD